MLLFAKSVNYLENGFLLYFVYLEYIKLERKFKIPPHELLSKLETKEKKLFTKILNSDDKSNFKTVITNKFRFNKNIDKHALIYFAYYTASIEILREGKLWKINFPLPTFHNYISNKMKENFEDKVDRSSTKSKVMELQLLAPKLIQTAEIEQNIQEIIQKSTILTLILNSSRFWSRLSYICMVFILTSLPFSYSRINDEENHLEKPMLFGVFYKFDAPERIILLTKIYYWILGTTIAVCSGVRLLNTLIRTVPLYFGKRKIQPNIYHMEENDDYDNQIGVWRRIKIVIAESPMLFFSLFYFAFCLLGIFIHPFFLFFSMVELIKEHPVLKTIVNSVWKPRKMLLWSLFLVLLLLYIFSIFTFMNYPKAYLGENITYLYQYWLINFDYSFKVNFYLI